MTAQPNALNARTADDEPEDVAVVGSGIQALGGEPQEDVLRAIRYLLYRHELTSGSPHLPQMIAVVSASGGEGVTTVSQSLAYLLASEQDAHVCWIDVGGSGSVPPALDSGSLTELPGIATIMHEVRPGQALDKPNPSAIRLASIRDTPQGQTGRRPRGGAELDHLLTGLASKYRYIIFDTPPLLSRVDSIGFLRHAEAYILVAKQGSTTLKQVRTIAEELRPIPPLGAILNDQKTRTPRSVRRFFRE